MQKLNIKKDQKLAILAGRTSDPPQQPTNKGGLSMSVYHIQRRSKIPIRKINNKDKRPPRKWPLPKYGDGEIVRPMYSSDGCLAGYIVIPISEWASQLRI